MSDQSPKKSSASDASKSFAIPSRPSSALTNGQKAPSWKSADNREESSPEPESTQTAQAYRQEQHRFNTNAPAISTRPPRAPEQTFSQSAPGEPSADESPFPQTFQRSAFSEQLSPEQLFSQADTFPKLDLSEQPFSQLNTFSELHPSGQQSSRSPQPSAFSESHLAEPSFSRSTQQSAFPAARLAEQQFSQQTAPTLGQQVLRPLQPPPSFATGEMGALSTQNYQRGKREQLSPTAPRKKARSRRRLLFIALAAIAVVVVLGGLLSQQLLNSGSSSAQNSALVFSGNGPYARLPLSAQQINAIQHLAGHMKYKALASLYVSHMSLDDEIGQLIMVEYNQTSYSSDLDYMLNTLHVGGVIMYEFQMTSAAQTKGDIAHMQQRANIPLLISTDEEGGPYVHRLSNIYGYRMSATQIEESGSTDVAKQQGLKTSRDLAALGINEDLAPDVDVNQVNGYDMVTRTFGNNASDVIKYAGAYLQAMQGNGTVACIKHFPGLGGALTDAHKGLPVVNSTKQQIYDIDLAPFKNFIQSPNALLNPGMIMPTDVLLPAIDAKYPAELSHTFMTDILRNEFGYDGVSLTDALYMQGITNTWDMYTASVMALQAGNDMLLGANGTSQTIGVINAIKQALKDGQLTKARIDESAARIIALKMQYHLMPTYIPGA
ncbi:MAG TPA: glycoside hydrolase family 3 N-terminal domain-containing protein [Ktedonobacteraceae bacterium]|nr:glycoside hydrolase family 3 N-terminal domain-containing protein [Ktedonobacteraceae bacterium]